jgi:hypothetical protein
VTTYVRRRERRGRVWAMKGDNIGTRRNLLRTSGLNCHWHHAEATMNGLIYLVGLVVVIMFILSFLGLR